MAAKLSHTTANLPNTDDWAPFPGGELEGPRPRALCPACRDALQRGAQESGSASPRAVLCFQCYRTQLERERALKAAGELETGSDERFQAGLPFEPVNRTRLAMLKAERSTARASVISGAGRFADRRRHAQIAARHALHMVAAGLTARRLGPADRQREMAAAIRGAELQLPEAWLPFVVSR